MALYAPNTRNTFAWFGSNVNQAEMVATNFSVGLDGTGNISVDNAGSDETGIVILKIDIHVSGYNGESTVLRGGLWAAEALSWGGGSWANNENIGTTSSTVTMANSADTNAEIATFQIRDSANTSNYIFVEGEGNSQLLLGFRRNDGNSAYTTLFDLDNTSPVGNLYYDNSNYNSTASPPPTFVRSATDSTQALVYEIEYAVVTGHTLSLSATHTEGGNVSLSMSGALGNIGSAYTGTDTWDLTIDWGDGSTDTVLSNIAGGTSAASINTTFASSLKHRYDPGLATPPTFTITMTGSFNGNVSYLYPLSETTTVKIDGYVRRYASGINQWVNSYPRAYLSSSWTADTSYKSAYVYSPIKSISAVTPTSPFPGAVTYTYDSSYGLIKSGDSVTISGLAPSGYNGTFSVVGVLTSPDRFYVTNATTLTVTDAVGSVQINNAWVPTFRV